MKPLLAVLAADLHLWHRPPLARSEEPDWLACLQGYLTELRQVATGVPLVIAGDLFDNWNAPPALVNWVLKHLPPCYAIPGNHELPHHRYEDVHKSAYHTLVAAGLVTDLRPGRPVVLPSGLVLHGFPFGQEIVSCKKNVGGFLQLAVVHDFICTRQTGYVGVPSDHLVGAYETRLAGYDVALFGDNHIPFSCLVGDCYVYNVGGFVRRKCSEIAHRPRVGLLHEDGSVTNHYLDTSWDRILGGHTDTPAEGISLTAFVQQLERVADVQIDFSQALGRRVAEPDVPLPVRQVVLEALERWICKN